MKLKIDFWLKLSLANLFLVALIGTFLRLKVNMELPFQQKHLLHAHSHFAFAGWISHTLMVLMIYYLKSKSNQLSMKRYIWLIIANLICSYGMLIFFIYQGYGVISIFFSTASILVSYAFAYYYYKDSKHLRGEVAVKWFQGALFFYVLSSIGTFFLAYSMTLPKINFDLYFASIYYYLHFQYNGWFLFVCIGLFLSMFNTPTILQKRLNRFFYILFIATLVTYGLSVLWLKVSIPIYSIVAFFGALQLLVWLRMQSVLIANYRQQLQHQPTYLKIVLSIVALCLFLKFVFQFLLVFPTLSSIAFGMRPVVIAYLHMVLLGIISLFMLYYIYVNRMLYINPGLRYSLIFFVAAVFFNELILALQGLAGYIKFSLPDVNKWLLLAAFLLLISSGLMAVFALINSKK